MISERNRKILGLAVALVSILLVFLGLLIAQEYFTVQKVTVSGAEHYSKKEIEDMVMDSPIAHNSLYLKLRYRNRSVENIPFIERMEVVIDSPKEITINVYEKAIAGYIEYLGRYMYFDKDGIIVESSAERTGSVPFVTGLKFSECVMYEALPVENRTVFSEILSITQLMNKYNINADRVLFGTDQSITLFFNTARVAIGQFDNIDEKMIRLQYIVPELDGMKGVLHMENYSEEDDGRYIAFETDGC
ncbi:MAG: FtsQ-type POTRA domain-containing protein [Lachnospiraceae bacterium]|nr:FtsQ-type POTRA domain-containing protein [Lachnospiraceae bacterium]